MLQVPDHVKVTVKYLLPPNKPPIADAGSDQITNAGQNVTLNGSATKDPDGNITSYSWVQTSGYPVVLKGADNVTAFFTAPNLKSDTILNFFLTVKDDKDAESNNPAIVSVTVTATTSVSNQTRPDSEKSITTTTSNNTTNISSSDVSALVKNGDALNNLGNYTEAIQYYEKALAIDPNNKIALNGKGDALSHIGR